MGNPQPLTHENRRTADDQRARGARADLDARSETLFPPAASHHRTPAGVAWYETRDRNLCGSRLDRGRTSSASTCPIHHVKTVLPAPLPEMCGTCPFREGSPYSYLRDDLARSALTCTSRICHQTGSRNAINARTGKPARLCRGARDVQLQHFHRIGVIPEPTDQAWADTWAKLQPRREIKR
jgi:hypothetical protein